jgi:hypothetical protein
LKEKRSSILKDVEKGSWEGKLRRDVSWEEGKKERRVV